MENYEVAGKFAKGCLMGYLLVIMIWQVSGTVWHLGLKMNVGIFIF